MGLAYIIHCQGVIFTLISLASLSNAHVRFVCPRPQSPRSDIYSQEPSAVLDGPCGLGNDVKFETEYTDVVPGPFTVQFEETVVHPEILKSGPLRQEVPYADPTVVGWVSYRTNSPFKITLHDFANASNFCVLLDHIPHNNAAKVDSHSCEGNSYPLGHCNKSKYYITINIPNMECERCFLRLMFIRIDNAPDLPCLQPNSTCMTYYSCANVKISQTEENRGKSFEKCYDYQQNLLGDWPYSPVEHYKASFSAPAVVDVLCAFHALDSSLTVFIPTRNIGYYLQRAGIYHSSTSGLDDVLMFAIDVSDKNIVNQQIVTTWNNMNASQAQELKIGDYSIHFQIKPSSKILKKEITLIDVHYQQDVYTAHNEKYTDTGWLDTIDFYGINAVYSEGIHPYGPCAPPPRYYIAALHGADEKALNMTHGAVGLMFLDQKVHIISIVMPVREDLHEIRLDPIHLGGFKSFVVGKELLTKNILDKTLDATDQIPQIGTNKFLTIATVNFTPSGSIQGDIEEGIMAVISGTLGFYGLATFQITKEWQLKYTIVLRHTEHVVMNPGLRGPARRGQEGKLLYKLPQVMPLTDGSLYCTGVLQDISSEFWVHLWLGHIYLTLDELDKGKARGQLSIPGSWYCELGKCPVTELLLNGMTDIDPGINHPPPHGLASFILDRTGALQYSIYINDPTDNNIMAEITHQDEAPLMNIPDFHPSLLQSNTYEVHGVVPAPSPSFLKYLSGGEVKVKVSTKKYQSFQIFGTIPVVSGDTCSFKQKTITVGEDQGHWNPSATLKDVTLLVDDELVFYYGDNDTVEIMASKDDYDKCDFTGTVVIGARGDGNKRHINYVVKNPTKLYIASRDNCEAEPPLKFIVTVVNALPKEERTATDECEKSLFQVWRERQIKNYPGTKVVPVTIGSFLGAFVILIIIIFWDKKHNEQAKCNEGFQRF